MAVSLRLLFLIVGQLHRLLALLGRTTRPKTSSRCCCATTIGRQRVAQST
jgi:hypothetical protein